METNECDTLPRRHHELCDDAVDDVVDVVVEEVGHQRVEKIETIFIVLVNVV